MVINSTSSPRRSLETERSRPGNSPIPETLHPTEHSSGFGTMDETSKIITETMTCLNSGFQEVNLSLHSHPEIGFQEVFAHKTLTDFLQEHGFAVKRHAWGLDTAFEATFGSGGRQVVFCAEYDALPEIGHGCGHNLIATSSLAAFVGAAHAMRELKLPGRVRILGTPAEEGGGGKIKLLEAGAFDPPEDISAAIMAHPSGSGPCTDGQIYDGIAGTISIANCKTLVSFRGRSSHAGVDPWNGVNALDAAVSAYVNVSMLRQQIRPEERVHGVFEVGGTVPNVISDYTRMNWVIRSPTISGCERLEQRVKACFAAGAAAADCDVEYDESPAYKDLRVNSTLCNVYVEEMAKYGLKIKQVDHVPASTDMGNVSYHVPVFHGGFAIPTTPDVSVHNPKFTACARTEKAHMAAMTCAKGLAMLAVRVLVDTDLAQQVLDDFL